MIVVDILHAVIGLAFALFIPGFLLTKIIFKEQELLETIAFSVAFSIAIDIFLGLFLGANKTMYEITGGITEMNVWFYIVIITVILGIVYLIKEKKLLKRRK
ncbi:DUF1616 domain-containing protein [Candidatus Woesearchaeota archaeon]|nr:DUF1616 domain-containing protein [Candidatus Woesearchaeota archaeon]